MHTRQDENPLAPSDFDLMRRVKAGDPAAFEALIQRHQQSLMNFFRRMGAYTDAEDLAQSTFLKLFQYRFKYREEAKFTTFLYTLARHTWIDGRRRTKRREEFVAEWKEEEEQSEASSASRPGVNLDAQAALERLPEKLRSVVVLGICQGVNYEEIARVLGIPVGTVKSRMFVALQRLKEFFNEG